MTNKLDNNHSVNICKNGLKKPFKNNCYRWFKDINNIWKMGKIKLIDSNVFIEDSQNGNLLKVNTMT